MARKLGEHYDANGIRETWFDNSDGTITVERSHDAQGAIDLVAAVNAEGAPTIDGLGKPVGEIPLVLAIEWADRRGIPWEKLLYGNDYDAEFKLFLQEYSKLAYRAAKTVHTVQ